MQPLVNSIGLLLVGAVLTFVAARYWFLRNQAVADGRLMKNEHDKLLMRVNDLERDNALVKAAVVPITTAFQALLIKELTHFHTPVMDALMVKIGPPNTLTPNEEAELIRLLAQRAEDLNGRISDSEREAAEILPVIMKRAKMEQDVIKKDSVLAIVSVPKMNGDDTLPQPPVDNNDA